MTNLQSLITGNVAGLVLGISLSFIVLAWSAGSAEVVRPLMPLYLAACGLSTAWNVYIAIKSTRAILSERRDLTSGNPVKD